MGTKKLKTFQIKVLAISGNSNDFQISQENPNLIFLFLVEPQPHAKFHNPRTILSVRKVCGGGWLW